MGEIGGDLDADEAVGALGLVVDRAEHVAGVPDVGDGEILEHRFGVGCPARSVAAMISAIWAS